MVTLDVENDLKKMGVKRLEKLILEIDSGNWFWRRPRSCMDRTASREEKKKIVNLDWLKPRHSLCVIC